MLTRMMTKFEGFESKLNLFEDRFDKLDDEITSLK